MLITSRIFWFIVRLCKGVWRRVWEFLRWLLRKSKPQLDKKTQKDQIIQAAIKAAERNQKASGRSEIELQGLHLTTVPEQLSHVLFIQQLNLSNNELQNIRPLLPLLPKLVHLDYLNLASNSLLVVTGRFWQSLPNSLRTLDLRNNRIKDLPLGKFHLSPDSCLSKINLSGNHLTNLTNGEWILSIPTLKCLNLSRNSIDSIELDNVVDCSLEELYLDYNYLETLPDGFDRVWKHLEILSLSSNEFRAFPDAVLRCRHLRELVLSRNTLKNLECTQPIQNVLPCLTTLRIDNNQIRSLPDWIPELKRLKALYCQSNQLETLRSLNALPNLKTLDFHANSLNEFPEWILANSTLRTVDCSFNQFYSLPECIHQWEREWSASLLYFPIPDRILPGLYFGSIEAEESLESVRKHQISHVIQVVRSPVQSHRNLVYFPVPIVDETNCDLSGYFKSVYTFIEEVRKEDGVVLIHGQRGTCASAAIVLSYLMNRFSYSFDEAYEFLKQRRPSISLSSSFVTQLKYFERHVSI